MLTSNGLQGICHMAKSLGIGYQDIENNYTAPADQRMSFLSKWIWKDGAAATYEKLSEVLERLGELGAAERIHEIGWKK